MKKVLLGLLVLVALAFAVIYWQNAQVPELGVTDGKLQPPGSRPNSVSTQADDPARRVDVLPMKATTANTRAAILYAIKSYGGAEIIEERPEYIYAVFTTPLMKYNDDVEFYIDREKRQVHFRSASRAGYSDRGLNRERYNALASFYNAWRSTAR